MHLFNDSTLNTWKLITEKLPEKPECCSPNYDFSCEDRSEFRELRHVCKCRAVEIDYNAAISALKQNALTVVNEELIAKGIDMDLETVRNVLWHGELIHWPGAYETKEKDIFVEAGGNYIHTETITVAILTLPEEKIEVHGTESGKLFIKPEDLFALSKVQETIKKAATRAEEKKNTMENMTKEQQHIEFDKHQKEIEKIILGCRGIQSRQVHWSEAVPMVAMYMTKELQKLQTSSGSVAAPKEEPIKRLLSDISEIDQLRTDKEMLKQALDHADAELASLRQQLKEREESIKELLPVAEERLKRIVNYDMPDYYRIRSGIQSSISRAKALLDKQ